MGAYRASRTSTRSIRPEYDAAILKIHLAGGHLEEPVRRQSAHMADYEAVLRGLVDRQLVYAASAPARKLPKRSRQRHTATPNKPAAKRRHPTMKPRGLKQGSLCVAAH